MPGAGCCPPPVSDLRRQTVGTLSLASPRFSAQRFARRGYSGEQTATPAAAPLFALARPLAYEGLELLDGLLDLSLAGTVLRKQLLGALELAERLLQIAA